MLSVEIEAAEKAGHCVDSARDIQVSAMAIGAVARIDSRAVLVLKPPDLCFCFGPPRRPILGAIVGVEVGEVTQFDDTRMLNC